MPITKYSPEFELKVGQWVCSTGVETWSFATNPVIIRAIKPASLVVGVPTKAEGSNSITYQEKKMFFSSIAWVFDTEAEGKLFQKHNSEFMAHALKKEEAFRAELNNDMNLYIKNALIEVGG